MLQFSNQVALKASRCFKLVSSCLAISMPRQGLHPLASSAQDMRPARSPAEDCVIGPTRQCGFAHHKQNRAACRHRPAAGDFPPAIRQEPKPPAQELHMTGTVPAIAARDKASTEANRTPAHPRRPVASAKSFYDAEKPGTNRRWSSVAKCRGPGRPKLLEYAPGSKSPVHNLTTA